MSLQSPAGDLEQADFALLAPHLLNVPLVQGAVLH